MTTLDYGEDATPAVTDGAMATIERLIKEQLDAELAVAQAERNLKHAEERLRLVSEKDLPEAMQQAGLEELKTPAGIKVSVEEKVSGSILKEKRTAAFAWLRANGFGGLVKREVSVLFGRGQDDKARELAEELAKKFEAVSDETSVNAMTLSAFVREQLKEGKNLPDLFSIFRQRAAKVVLPKAE